MYIGKALDVDHTTFFCGIGGDATAFDSLGFNVKLALNHWQIAKETIETNHPHIDTRLCDISEANPSEYPHTRSAWFSPECTSHTLAKGVVRKNQKQSAMWDRYESDPNEVRSRMTMGDVPRFAEYHHYDTIVVENVVDAKLYWSHWDKWLKDMINLGYDYKIVYLNSMFAGTPQSRDRLYIVFWKHGHPKPDLDFRPRAFCENCAEWVAAVQSWKNPQKRWGKYNSQYIYCCPRCARRVHPPVNAAATIIDWSKLGTRIADRAKPLKDTTMERIRKGLERYKKDAFLVETTKSDDRVRSTNDPLATMTCTNGLGVVSPFMVCTSHDDDRITGIGSPMPTQTTRQDMALAFILNNGYGSGDRISSVDEQLPTITSRNHPTLVAPMVFTYNSNNYVDSVEQPMRTIVAGGNHHFLLTPPLLHSMYTGYDRVDRADKPITTLTTIDHHALLTPDAWLVPYYGASEGMRSTGEPIGTLPTHEHYGLVRKINLDELTVENCHFRMLGPEELKQGQDFPIDYQLVGTNKDQVKGIGNAVSVKAAYLIGQRILATYQ